MSTATLQEAFDAQIARSKKSSEALNAQLTAKDAKIAAESENALMIAHMVLSETSKIRVPKDGNDGHDGLDGIHGIDGIRGLTGKTGAKGEKGDIGPQGKTGEVGPKGDTGKDGIDGVVGFKGTDGIQGERGEPGNDGLNGRDGTNGEDGIDGKDGATGPRGEAGRDGKDGINGTIGIDGKEGLQGKKGPKGDQGPRGLTGKQGVKGKDGSKGKSGDDGIGIKSIASYGNTLNIQMTDGKINNIWLPQVGGTSKVVASTASYEVQRAARTPYIPTFPQTATNVQDALDVALVDNFSVDIVDYELTIPYNQQMVIHGSLDILSPLNLDGRLILEI